MYTHFKRKLNTAIKFLTSCRLTPNSTVVHAPGTFCTNACKSVVGIADSLPQKKFLLRNVSMLLKTKSSYIYNK